MKFEIEISEEYLQSALQNAASDYVYDNARRIVDLAIDRNLEWQKKLRRELYNEITEAVARKLDVVPEGSK